MPELQPNQYVKWMPINWDVPVYPQYEPINQNYGDKFNLKKVEDQDTEPWRVIPTLTPEQINEITGGVDIFADRIIDPKDPSTFHYIIVDPKTLDHMNAGQRTINMLRESYEQNIRPEEIEFKRQGIIERFLNKIEEEGLEEPARVRQEWEKIIDTTEAEIRNTVNLTHCAEAASKRELKWKTQAQGYSEDDPVWRDSNWRATRSSKAGQVCSEAAQLQ